MRRALCRLGVGGLLVAAPKLASAQVGSSNVPLPNVMLLLDTSGSFEYMINGSKPEDPANNPSGGPYASCEQAFNTLGTATPKAALPNRWGVVTQALTGTVLNGSGNPFYSCVTMDRLNGPSPSSMSYAYAPGASPNVVPTTQSSGPFLLSGTGPNAALTTQVEAEGLDIQYGLRNENAGAYAIPYDSGYYLPFHRPVSVSANGTFQERCVYSPGVLPGAVHGGVGIAGGVPAATDCPNEGSGVPCASTDFPPDAIGQFYYDTLANGTTAGTAITSSTEYSLTTPNAGFASGASACTFGQANDGLMDQASSLVRFGLMTFDNDPDPDTGASISATPYFDSPFLGQWSYFSSWSTFPVPASAASPAAVCPVGSTAAAYANTCGMPAQCTYNPFELGARNSAAPPWEGRLMGFPNADADVLTTVNSNSKIQTAINAMRPYGATPTAALMSDAAYYFWADPAGPNGTTKDPLVAGKCRSQYIILLTDGSPNQDERTACQPSSGMCPYHLPEETAYLLSQAGTDTTGSVYTTLPAAPANGNVFTYVIGFAVSGDNKITSDAGAPVGTGSNATNPNLANCAQLTASQLSSCGATAGTAPLDTTDGGVSAESPCCSLQRIAVAGGTQHAYFADTPGDLNAALAAVLGDIEGQLGSRTLPVASPTVSYGTGAPTTSTFVSTFQAASSCPTTGPCLTAGVWSGDVQRSELVCGTAIPTAVAADDFGTDLATQNATGTSRNFLIFNGGNSTGTPSGSTNALTIRPYMGATTIGSAPLDNLDTFSVHGQAGHEVMAVGSSTPIFSELTSGGVLPCTSSLCASVQTSPVSCQDPATLSYGDPTTCANLAVAFTLGQSSFLPDPSDPNVSNAATNLKKQFNSGTDGNNVGPATNRAASPLGAILDSTPAVVGLPAAQVRDDSYQAFAKSIASVTTPTARDTMLYVATVDGMLHAFDTTVGYTGGATNAEAWAFIPPAVLPKLMANYPAASNILLDGAPVVKDVVFNRTAPGAPDQDGNSPWHTMLVAGFGSGGRGYYAVDVTDPRPPASAPAPVTTFTSEGYQTYVGPVGSGSTPNLKGPHFQWQITGANLTGNTTYASGNGTWTTELFGSTSAIPAIATVFADPSMQPASSAAAALNPQEMGIAILPGGINGAPVSGGTCARELAGLNYGAYKVNGNTLFSKVSSGNAVQLTATNATSPYNLSDANFPPRLSVRQWAPSCSALGSSNPTGLASNVPGRSVMVVSVATGQILAVFARAQPIGFSTSKAPNGWDVPSDGNTNSIINSNYLIPTPLDSPMTGTPVVYPSGVGVVAQAFYIGDADGTLWRFDVSDPNPRNWVGSIFADAYSPGADLSKGDSASISAANPDWPALDSEAISVPPVLALDTTGTLTVDFSTGDQTSFNACYSVPGLSPTTKASGITSTFCSSVNATAISGPVAPAVNFLYSVAETRASGSSTPLARVNWYNEWTSGERVTGPMAIFNGILYFASYAPTTATGGLAFGSTPGLGTTAQEKGACITGGANLFAWDFARGSPCTGSGAAAVGCGGSTVLAGSAIDPAFSSPSSAPSDPGSSSSGTVVGRLPSIQNPAGTGSLPSNTVVPGVTIGETPSCVAISTTPQDAYAGALHNSFANQSSGTYTLTANIGKKSSGAKSNIITQPLKAPTSPTVVDSWATIAE